MNLDREQLHEFGQRVVQEYKRAHHDWFSNYCQAYMLEHPEDGEAMCRFLDGYCTALDVRNQETP